MEFTAPQTVIPDRGTFVQSIGNLDGFSNDGDTRKNQSNVFQALSNGFFEGGDENVDERGYLDTEYRTKL